MVNFKKGEDVYIFYRMFKKTIQTQNGDRSYFAVIDPRHGIYRPRMGLAEGWLPGRIAEDFDGTKATEVKVEYLWPHFFTERGNLVDVQDPQNIYDVYRPAEVRRASDYPSWGKLRIGDSIVHPASQPDLSIITFRWGGLNEIVAPEQWGETGSPVSKTFLDAFLDTAVIPRLGREFEVWTVYIQDQTDLKKLADTAHLIFGGSHPSQRAKRVCAMYFLYPTGFEENCIPNMETGEDGGAALLDQKSLFRLMQSMERTGIMTKFPHCSGLYELITSKRWTYNMSLAPHLQVPATIAVPRQMCAISCEDAASQALSMLEKTAKRQYEIAGLQKGNEKVSKGVAKLGFSWEALDVKFWDGLEELEDALHQLTNSIEINSELTGQPHDCESILVQEYIKHDLELRVYCIDGKVEGMIYTKFCKIKDNKEFGDFKQNFNRQEAARAWMGNDVAALEDGETQCHKLCGYWIQWLEAQCCETPAAIRFDFFIKRAGQGYATVWILEICENGFSMLGDRKLPGKVFQAMLRSCLGGVSGSESGQNGTSGSSKNRRRRNKQRGGNH